MPTPEEAESRFRARVERRLKFLDTMLQCEVGVFLPADVAQRKNMIANLVRMTAHPRELPHLKPAVFDEMTKAITDRLESMQRVLPHDVQYRNRVRRDW